LTEISKPTVAYVVLGWNNKDLLDECLESIMAQDYPDKKIVLVDNNSDDDSVEYVKDKYPSVEVLAQAKNHGFAKGNNIGIEHALKDPKVGYVVLVNTDATLATNWTSTLVGFAADRPRAALLQTITLDYYDHDYIDSTHIFISRLGQATQGSYRRAISDELDAMPMKTFGCNAAAILITRKFIEAQPFSHFFDEAMFMYLEDVDVAARATVMGWDCFLVPGSRAYHMGSASSSKNPGFSLYMTYRNNTRLLLVNLPFLMFLRMIPRLVRGDRATMEHLRMMGKDEAAKKVRDGRLNGLLRLPLALPRAIRLHIAKRISSKELWQLMERGY
jgi:GT2 family glycosyltransferase